MRALFLLLLILAACQSLENTDYEQQLSIPDTSNVFINAFNNPECSNPCWLGIELGVTNRKTAINILQKHNIEFTFEGYGGGVLHFHRIPDNLVPGLDPEGSSPGNIYGDMSIGENDTDIVGSMDFFLDLCVSTIVNVYGEPGVWHTREGLPHTLVYPGRQTFFQVDPESKRIDWVILHMDGAYPPIDDLDSWSKYAHAFADKCTDVFTVNDD